MMVFELCEVFCGVEGRGDSVQDRELSLFWCPLPVANPCCLGGGFGSA